MVYRAFADIWSAFKEFNEQALFFAMVAVIIYSVIIILNNVIRAIQGKPFLHAGKVVCKMILFAIFGMYASYTVSLTLSGREAGSRSGIPMLVPGSTIFKGTGISIFSVENILLFLPFGFLIPLLWKYNRSIVRTMLMTFICSTLIELTQLATGRGYFEIDDIILNTLGGVIGYIVFACIYDGCLAVKKRTIEDVARESGKAAPLGKLYNRFAVDHEWALVILQMAPVAFMIKLIVGFSNDVAEVSTNYSRPFAFVVAKVASKLAGNQAEFQYLYNSIDPLTAQSDFLNLVEKIIRKMAHVTEYALLALFVWALIYSRSYISRMFSYITGIAVVLIVGMWDELNQTTVEGRFGSIKDVGVDFAGALIIMIIIMIIMKNVRNHYKKKMV